MMHQNRRIDSNPRRLIRTRRRDRVPRRTLLEQLILRIIVLRTTHNIRGDTALVCSACCVAACGGKFVAADEVGACSGGGHLTEEEGSEGWETGCYYCDGGFDHGDGAG